MDVIHQMVDMSGQRALAVITGASSGIGLEIAKVLASQKYNLIICARREKELLDFRIISLKST